jgi:hypothetical protein
MRNLLFMVGFAGLFTSCMVSQTYQLTGEPLGEKVGVARSSIIGNSDTSIKTAADNGGIKVIGAVEMTTKVFFFTFSKTKVYGN